MAEAKVLLAKLIVSMDEKQWEVVDRAQAEGLPIEQAIEVASEVGAYWLVASSVLKKEGVAEWKS